MTGTVATGGNDSSPGCLSLPGKKNDMHKDNLVFELISKELERQRKGIDWFVSENFTNWQGMQAIGTSLTNK